jgi:PKD repeat protein
MKRFTIAFLLAFMAMAISAQRFTNETPPSFAYGQIAKAKPKSSEKLAVPFDVRALEKEDAENERLGFPVRVAKTIPADLTPENTGEWITLPNGQRIWRLEIEAPHANAISLLYDKFIIPLGGKLFIYSPDYKVIDVFTDRDNPKKKEYATDFIPGDKIRLEYVEPLSAEQLEINRAAMPQTSAFLTKGEKLQREARSKFPVPNASEQEPLQLAITGVSYAYKDVLANISQIFSDIQDRMEIRTPTELGRSDACEVNINDTEGADWFHRKKGIAATLQVLSDGLYICSGTVVNNALEDLTPYFLMAYHCGGEATEAQFNQWLFYFHWERTGADDASPLAEYKLMTGATKKVGLDINGGSDGLLLQLNSPVPTDFDVFYNGWDRRDAATAGGVCIHHPAGDVKKISTYTAAPLSYTWNGSGAVGADNAHWNVIFTATEHGHGVSEGGSSGAPLFDSAGRVIGTLTGGNSSCTNTSGANIFGKFAWHWDQSPDPDLRMSTFLDPNNTGIEYIDGTYGGGYNISFTASKTNIFASEEITFSNRSYGDIDTYIWSFTGGEPAGHEGEYPPAVTYSAPGNYIAKLTAEKAGETVGEMEVPIKVTLKQNYCLQDPVEIGNGTSTSEYPFGMGDNATRNVLSSAIYTASELNMAEGGLINEIEWTADAAVPTARTLYVYLKEVEETSFDLATTWDSEIEGATLVCQNAAWTNTAGANKITLTAPFEYSGTGNLKVLVRVSSSSEIVESAQCRYTASATDTHQQWGSTSATLPSDPGTPNANRPNIKLYSSVPCGVEMPVADFIVAKEIVSFKEDFDNASFPPDGWEVEKPGESSSQWIAGNASSNNFDTIDPDSKYSAVISYDDNAVVDSWLKSPAVTIDKADAKIEFYVLYSGNWLSGGTTTFSVSDDEGTTWASKWTTGAIDDPSLLSEWRKQEINLSEYEGKTIRFAWQYYGQGGDLAGIDGIKVILPNTEGKAVIYEGEFVSFTDCSTGPVVIWNWTLPGATPSASDVTDPMVQYMDAGVYGAELLVKNTMGTDSKTVSDAVTVIARKPVSQFVAYSNGLIKQADFGPFLPSTGGSVAFEHSTLYYPKSIAWSFPGAEPASSTEESPEVEYPAGEAKYDVTLEATNSAGTSIEAKTGYVQVGGKAEIWNVRPEESPVHRYTSSGYSITGADLFPQTAERFEASGYGEVSQVRVYTGNVVQSPSAHLTLAIYSDNGGIPGTALSPVLQIQGGEIANGDYNTLVFPAPVPVSGAFHVVVGSTDYGSTYFTVPCVENRKDEYGTVSVYYGEEWMDITDLLLLYTSMNIVPEFAYAEAELTSPALYNKSNSDTAAETIAFSSTGHSWNASASDDWILLNETEGLIDETGKGTLSFTVSENAVQNIRKGSIKLNVSGGEFKIYVMQAGNAPENLTATYSDEETAINIAWEHEIMYAVQSQATFNDAASGIRLMKETLPDNNRLVGLKHGQGMEAVEISSIPEVKNAPASTGVNSAMEEILQWYNGDPAYIYGNPSGGHIEVAVRFAPEDLFFYDKATVKAVEIYTYRPATNVKINIRKGDQIIHTQDIEDITENLKLQRIELTTPVLIDGSEDLYIGYEFDQAAGDAQSVYVPIADAGPAITGKGDLFSYEGDPFESTGVGNWLITAFVEPAPVDMTFNLYKNGTLLAEGLTEKVYVDEEVPQVNERARYTVTAVYGKPELTSTESAPATIYAPVSIVTDDPLEFCDGGEATLQTVDEEGYTYQWYRDNAAIADAVNSSYVATEGGIYSVQVVSEEGKELSLLEPVTVIVNERLETPLPSVIHAGGGIVTFVINNPQEGVSYQWYMGSEAIGEPVESNAYTVHESGIYSVIAVKENECPSVPSAKIAVTVVLTKDLFSVPTDPVQFAGAGEQKEIALTVSDPEDYISALGMTLHTNAPDWITVEAENNALIFEASANETNALRSDVIQIWYGQPDSGFDLNDGYEIEISQKSLQSIAFEMPEILYLEDETYLLSATATSGLEVSFSLRDADLEYAEIEEGTVLRLKQVGDIAVIATVEGNDVFEEATNTIENILIRKRTGVEAIDKGKLTVYPNPSRTNQLFHVESGLDESELRNAFIDVYNLSGTLILRQEVTGKTTEMSLPVQGTYLLRLKGEEIKVFIK